MSAHTPGMSRQQALEFARASAIEAVDQFDEYDDPFGSYQDNVGDTLNEHHAGEFRDEAYAVFHETYFAALARVQS